MKKYIKVYICENSGGVQVSVGGVGAILCGYDDLGFISEAGAWVEVSLLPYPIMPALIFFPDS